MVAQLLDRKPRRVFLEAQVVEISVTDDLLFGLDAGYSDPAHTNSAPAPLRGHVLESSGLLAPAPSADGSSLNLAPNLTQLARAGSSSRSRRGASTGFP